ncbi:MAG TPA: hypothetical protein VMM38_09300 [Aridibacter sp.]|nr:hypothetical protein [Aridibacter sp.]
MEITKDRLPEIISRAMERTSLSQSARILFHSSGLDFVARTQAGKIIHEIRPIWNVGFLYPMGDGVTPARYEFEIETLQFHNESEMEEFLVSYFRSEIGEG